MIVIYAQYPFPDRVRGGWMRRIAAVERIFAERPRTYVFPADPAWPPSDYRVHAIPAAPGASFVRLDLRLSNHCRHLTDLVESADFVYAHTSHSAQHLLPYYRTAKIVTDLHGIAPEEEDLQGKPGRAAFFGALEETMIRESAALVTVTEAMADHFRAKYAGLTTPVILLPIVEDMPEGSLQRPARTRPTVVYAGGVQQWQNVDRMLDAVARCQDRFEFRFYTDSPEVLRAAAHRRGVGGALRVDTAAPRDLPAVYADADLGFVLRDDSAVNRVSCPTKLSEYLAFGVVPVVTLADIGDFRRLGYRYLALDDLLAGRVPDAASLADMRQRNRAVFAAIQRSFAAGAQQLASFRPLSPRSIDRSRSLFLTTLERSAFYPVQCARIEVERADGRHAIALDDEIGAVVDRDLELPGDGELRGLRVWPGTPPFVISPIDAEVRTADGAVERLELRGDYRTDRFGNWQFTGVGSAAGASALAVREPRRLRLRFEVPLVGPEALIAVPPPSAAPGGLVAALRRRLAGRGG